MISCRCESLIRRLFSHLRESLDPLTGSNQEVCGSLSNYRDGAIQNPNEYTMETGTIMPSWLLCTVSHPYTGNPGVVLGVRNATCL